MKRMLGFAIGIFLLWTSMVYAATTVTLQYTEPSTNAAGNALTNLKETTIYLKQDGGAEQVIKVPASKPQGGGSISKTVPVSDPPLCGSTTLTAQVSASNTNVTSFESVRSAITTGSKAAPTAGCATPNAPFGLTITID